MYVNKTKVIGSWAKLHCQGKGKIVQKFKPRLLPLGNQRQTLV